MAATIEVLDLRPFSASRLRSVAVAFRDKALIGRAAYAPEPLAELLEAFARTFEAAAEGRQAVRAVSANLDTVRELARYLGYGPF